jgi:hypothetical protein
MLNQPRRPSDDLDKHTYVVWSGLSSMVYNLDGNAKDERDLEQLMDVDSAQLLLVSAAS